jgi:hypothetical protein
MKTNFKTIFKKAMKIDLETIFNKATYAWCYPVYVIYQIVKFIVKLSPMSYYQWLKK